MNKRSLFIALRSALFSTSLAGVASTTFAAAGDSAVAAKATAAGIEEMLIVGVRENRVSKGATGLELNLKETPQSISIVSQQQMKDFGANSINEALRLATGIQVEQWETNRTNYVSRGFEIKSTQVDGVGLPNDWGIVTGAIDSFGYDKIEVIRGANGLLTGVGNASGTINYVRKRPTNTAQGNIELTAGSYDLRRIETDLSGPITDDGAWAGRIAIAAEDKDSHVRDMSDDRTFIYAVVDGQLGEKSTITAGHTYQIAHTDGNMWGALVLGQSDGTQAEFDTDASTAQNWAYWDTTLNETFVEYTYALPREWQLKGTYSHRSSKEDDQLFFALSTTGLDPVTGLGLIGWPGAYMDDNKADLFDLTTQGEFSAFGRTHAAILGANYSKSELNTDSRPVDPLDPANLPTPPFPYEGDVVPEPVWGSRQHYSTTNIELSRLYGSTRLSLSDRLHAVLGVNFIEYQRDGDLLGATFDQKERESSPYAGLTYAITPDLIAYFSYSDIYQAQDQRSFNGSYLMPTKGVNYEIGLKGEWLQQRLLGTVALFSAEQEGLGTFAGVTDDARYWYTGQDIRSEGIEAELTGQLNDYVQVVLGFTALQIEDDEGEDTYEWVPRRTANFTITAKMPFNSDISTGLSGKWQSKTEKVDEYNGILIEQGSYARVNGFVRYQITEQLHVAINVNNITDEKHLTSLYQIGYYAAPRNASASVGWRF